MATLTQQKRTARPAKYEIKDARTRVYAMVYGRVLSPSAKTHDRGAPSLNELRQHIPNTNHRAARETLLDVMKIAQFEKSTESALLAHHGMLCRTQRSAA